MKNGLIIIGGIVIIVISILFFKGILSINSIQITYAFDQNQEQSEIKKENNSKENKNIEEVVKNNNDFNSVINNQINTQMTINEKIK